jgi:endo-1,4-beta-D-glucanase Y
LPTSGTYGKSTDAGNAYNAWKSAFVQTCSGKGSRVLFDDNSSTVSEGIAYGMLLSAYAGDKPLFDALWQFYKASSTNGIMDWKWSNCTGKNQSGGATDAEFDAAMALIIAEEQWPTATAPYDYKAEATPLIANIRTKEIHPTSYEVLNGDAWGQGSTCRNPSYMAPAYFREFAKIETSQATFWNNAISKANTFLSSNRNSTTGLVSNWANAGDYQPNNCNGANEYGFDACRNPWRMANDVLWNGASTATTASDICNKVSSWLSGNEANLKGPLPMNASNPSVGQYKNGTFSTYALAVMGTSSARQNSLNSCYTNVVGLGNDNVYFNATLLLETRYTSSGRYYYCSSK